MIEHKKDVHVFMSNFRNTFERWLTFYAFEMTVKGKAM